MTDIYGREVREESEGKRGGDTWGKVTSDKLNTFGCHIRRRDYQAVLRANEGICEFMLPVLVKKYEVSHASSLLLVWREFLCRCVLDDPVRRTSMPVGRDVSLDRLRQSGDSKCYWDSGEIFSGAAEYVFWKEGLPARLYAEVAILLCGGGQLNHT